MNNILYYKSLVTVKGKNIKHFVKVSGINIR